MKKAKIIRPKQFEPKEVAEARENRRKAKARDAAARRRDRKEEKRRAEERFGEFFWRQSQACDPDNWDWPIEKLEWERRKRYRFDRTPANDNKPVRS